LQPRDAALFCDHGRLSALRDLLCPAPGSDLDRFGAQLLGYDAFTGEDLPFPDGIMQMSRIGVI